MSSRSGTVRNSAGMPSETALVGDAGGQVRLTAAVAALQQQPAIEVVGVVPARALKACCSDSWCRLAGCGRPRGWNVAKVRRSSSSSWLRLYSRSRICDRMVGLAAGAGLQPAEVRVPERQLVANVAQPVAVRAGRIAHQVAARLSVRRSRRSRLRRIAGEPLQGLGDLLVHRVPSSASPPGWPARSASGGRCSPRRCGSRPRSRTPGRCASASCSVSAISGVRAPMFCS